MATLLSSSPSSQLLLRKIPNPNPRPIHPLFMSFPLRPSPTQSSLAISASLLSPPPPVLATSTSTITSILSLIISFSSSLAASLHSVPSTSPLFASTSSLFFARMRSDSISTPMTVIAKGMGKWLDLYSGVLMVRVLLSWFPNIPWDRQPLSAIRDLCDPYLALFRNIIPPIFDTLDVSPLLAFAVLGLLSGILSGNIR